MKLIGSIALGLALAGCGMAHPEDDKSPQGTRSFALTGFDSVSLAGSDDVEVVVGPAFSVTASGPQAVLDRLEISVEGTGLKVSRKRTVGWHWSGRGAQIRVTMPAITAANVAGSGDMTVDKAEGESFNAAIAGSGDLSVKAIKVETLDANILGSGDVSLAGTASKAALSIAGSGTIRADELTAGTAAVSVLGSGDVNLRATESVTGNIAGSGDVNVRGTNKCTVSKAGSGSINCQP